MRSVARSRVQNRQNVRPRRRHPLRSPATAASPRRPRRNHLPPRSVRSRDGLATSMIDTARRGEPETNSEAASARNPHPRATWDRHQAPGRVGQSDFNLEVVPAPGSPAHPGRVWHGRSNGAPTRASRYPDGQQRRPRQRGRRAAQAPEPGKMNRARCRWRSSPLRGAGLGAARAWHSPNSRLPARPSPEGVIHRHSAITATTIPTTKMSSADQLPPLQPEPSPAEVDQRPGRGHRPDKLRDVLGIVAVGWRWQPGHAQVLRLRFVRSRPRLVAGSSPQQRLSATSDHGNSDTSRRSQTGRWHIPSRANDHRRCSDGPCWL